MRATKRYKSLPFNPALKTRARELRKAGILHEALLWLELKNQKLNGLDFDRQKIIGNYIVDFYCAEAGVVLEVDGYSHDHQQPQDALRDQYLHGLGLVVIRLSVKDVLQNMAGVIDFLRNHPALMGTPPREGNIHLAGGCAFLPENRAPALTGTSPEEGNKTESHPNKSSSSEGCL